MAEFLLNSAPEITMSAVFRKMKDIHSTRKGQLGFSLVEAALSIGVLSFGFLSLAPLLGVGLTSAHQGRESRMGAQIAETLEDEAQQGTLAAGTAYFDAEGEACTSALACYRTDASLVSASSCGTRLTVQVTPVASPQRAQFYAVVLLSQ